MCSAIAYINARRSGLGRPPLTAEVAERVSQYIARPPEAATAQRRREARS
jgi:hypothetical protein